jgi:DNA-directed RNA polymerase specialized sigma24 family protein
MIPPFRAIDVLPSIEATVVRLQHVEGLTHGQIAARLGLRVATVASTA